MVQVSVMGAGSWDTTLAKVSANAGNPVQLWSRRAKQAQHIQMSHENHDYLPGLGLPHNIEATSDAETALTGADVVVLGVSLQTLCDNLKVWKDFIGPETVLLSLIKGVECETHLHVSEVITEVTDLPTERIAVLFGPNLVREVATEQPAATIIACADESNAKMIQAAVATNHFRPYTNTDVIGCEIGGTCRNVIALACDMVADQGLDENTLAAIITCGLAEITRLGDAVGVEDKTFAGLVGLGDLVATCSSPLSRNYTFGDRLSRGDTMEQTQHATRGQVVEGVISSISVRDLARRNGVEIPITEAACAVCRESAKINETIRKLMGRSRKSE